MQTNVSMPVSSKPRHSLWYQSSRTLLTLDPLSATSVITKPCRTYRTWYSVSYILVFFLFWALLLSSFLFRFCLESCCVLILTFCRLLVIWFCAKFLQFLLSFPITSFSLCLPDGFSIKFVLYFLQLCCTCFLWCQDKVLFGSVLWLTAYLCWVRKNVSIWIFRMWAVGKRKSFLTVWT